MSGPAPGTWAPVSVGVADHAEAPCCHACGGMLHGSYWISGTGDPYCSPDCEAAERRAEELYERYGRVPWPERGEGGV